MAENLHYSIPPFFESILNKHSAVWDWDPIYSHNGSICYIYELKRRDSMSEMKVYLADAYMYSLTEYYQRPDIIGEGDCICIVRPEASFSPELTTIVKSDGIHIGKLSATLGAINRAEPWKYSTPPKGGVV